MIDRKDPEQAVSALTDFARYIEKNNYAAVIFPEGTRSRTGKPKKFSSTGFKTLLTQAPSAMVLPVTINHSWKLGRPGKFPMPVFMTATWEAHPPIDPSEHEIDWVVAETERLILSKLVES